MLNRGDLATFVAFFLLAACQASAQDIGVSPAMPCAWLDARLKQLAEEVSAEDWRRARLLNAVCALPTDDLTLADAEKALGDRPFSVALDDNSVTLIARTDGAKPQGLCCTVQDVTWTRIGQSRRLWAVRLRLERAREALLTLTVVNDLDAPWPDFVRLRGPEAPPAPVIWLDPEIKGGGEVVEETLFSPQLNETRKLTIWRPPGFDPAKRYPALVLADGASAAYYARMLEPMLYAGDIRPFVVIGVNSGAKAIVDPPDGLPRDVRSADYLPGFSGRFSDRFDQHLAFVADTVLPWAAEGHAIDLDDVAVAGQSNGGTFALHAGLRRPDRFRAAIPVSPGFGQIDDAVGFGPDYADFYISAGLYEPSFLRSATISAAALEAVGALRARRWNAAGHAPDQTDQMFALYLPMVFPPED